MTKVAYPRIKWLKIDSNKSTCVEKASNLYLVKEPT